MLLLTKDDSILKVMLPGLVAHKPVAYKKSVYQVETSRNFKISCPMSARFRYSTTKKLISQIKPCQTNSDHDRQLYVKLKSSWNSTIKETKKKNFHKNTLSSKHSIEVLKTVNKLLKMQKKKENILWTDNLDDINQYFNLLLHAFLIRYWFCRKSFSV